MKSLNGFSFNSEKLQLVGNGTINSDAVNLGQLNSALTAAGIAIPNTRVAYGTGTGLSSDANFTYASSLLTAPSFFANNGSASAVSFRVGNAGRGIYSDGTNLNFAIAGNERFRITSTGRLLGQYANNVVIGGGNENLGGNNTLIGVNAGINFPPSVGDVVGIGYNAVANATGGAYLIAIGRDALLSNTTGQYIVAVGYDALRNNSSGAGLISIGASSLASNTTGNLNVALGTSALAFNRQGSANFALGDISDINNINGSYRISIGYACNANAPNTSSLSNIIAIGSEINNTASNQVKIGNASIDSFQLKNGIYDFDLSHSSLGSSNNGQWWAYDVTSGKIKLTDRLLAGNGSESQPSISLSSNTTTGFYSAGGEFYYTQGGIKRTRIGGELWQYGDYPAINLYNNNNKNARIENVNGQFRYTSTNGMSLIGTNDELLNITNAGAFRIGNGINPSAVFQINNSVAAGTNYFVLYNVVSNIISVGMGNHGIETIGLKLRTGAGTNKMPVSDASGNLVLTTMPSVVLSGSYNDLINKPTFTDTNLGNSNQTLTSNRTVTTAGFTTTWTGNSPIFNITSTTANTESNFNLSNPNNLVNIKLDNSGSKHNVTTGGHYFYQNGTYYGGVSNIGISAKSSSPSTYPSFNFIDALTTGFEGTSTKITNRIGGIVRAELEGAVYTITTDNNVNDVTSRLVLRSHNGVSAFHESDIVHGTGGMRLRTPTGLSQSFEIGATTHMFLNATGLGVGTSSPSTKLHVVGGFRLVDGNQANGKVLVSDANGLGTWQTFSSGVSGSGTLKTLPMWTPNGTTLGDSPVVWEGSIASMMDINATALNIKKNGTGSVELNFNNSNTTPGLSSHFSGLIYTNTGSNAAGSNIMLRVANGGTISFTAGSLTRATFQSDGVLNMQGYSISNIPTFGMTGSNVISAQQVDTNYEKKTLSGSVNITQTMVNGATYSTTISVTGASVGDVCVYEFQSADILTNFATKAMVTSTNTVTVYLGNASGVTQTFTNVPFKVKVFK